jgi:hypothetical protein
MVTVGNVTSLHRILKFQGWPVPSEVAQSVWRDFKCASMRFDRSHQRLQERSTLMNDALTRTFRAPAPDLGAA